MTFKLAIQIIQIAWPIKYYQELIIFIVRINKFAYNDQIEINYKLTETMVD